MPTSSMKRRKSMAKSNKFAIEPSYNIKSQPDRFRELAKDLGCDPSEERFNEALKKVAKAKPSEPKKRGRS